MIEFKKEITITIEGKSSKELSSEELFGKLKIEAKNWWISNPSWPYGKPCDELIDIEIKNVELRG